MPIPSLRSIPYGETIARTYRAFQRDDGLTYSAALAFHAVLALFPFLVFVVALLAFLHLPGLFDPLVHWAGTALPDPAAGQVATVTREVAAHPHGGLLSLSVLGAVWAASGGIRSAMRVLNIAYGMHDPRSAWQRYVASIGYTIGLAALVLVCLVLLLVGPRVVEWMAGKIGLAGIVVTLWRWLRYPAAALLLAVIAAIFYSIIPRVHGVRFLSAGSVLAVLLWIALSLVFELYVDRFADFSAIYGSIAAVIVLLLYAWLSCIALLIGAELNAVLHGHQGGERAGPR